VAERAKEVARFILDNNATVRTAGKAFGVSKSTIHKDIARMQQINPIIYSTVRRVMDEHTAIRHIHGGESTRKVWRQRKQS
jgi:putative DeoR family transcriptional regulator (stage III sporulation protein D)